MDHPLAEVDEFADGADWSRMGAAAAVIITAGAAWFGYMTASPGAAPPSASSYLVSVDPYRMTP